MLKEEITTMHEAIDQKMGLVETMEAQMAPHVEAGTLTPLTLHAIRMARDNFTAATMHLREGNLEKCLYFMLRGSWNLGEFIIRAQADKAAAAPEE